MINALSIDVEDYFQVSNFKNFIPINDWNNFQLRAEKNTLIILELLAQFNVKATFFILGWVAQKAPNLVKTIAQEGHEIACHGFNHQLIFEQSPAEFKNDICRAKKLIEDISGNKVCGYRAPSYSVVSKTLWALEILLEEGFQYDSSIFPIHHDRYGIYNAPRHHYIIKCENGCIEEFPPATVMLGKTVFPIGGGGYFRLFPYSFTHFGLKQINNGGNAFTFYIHPWEIDPKQPKFENVNVLKKFRHYVNLHTVKGRLQKLLQNFQFTTLQNLLLNKNA